MSKPRTGEPAPPPPDLDDRLELARLRVWAAVVRDDGAPELRDDGRLLCCLLDLLPNVTSDGLRALARENVQALAGRIRARAKG